MIPGSNSISPSRLSHITELDLTDNLLGEWSEVELLVRTFPNLEFLGRTLFSDGVRFIRDVDVRCRHNNSLCLYGMVLDYILYLLQ